jgi:hypothetical protein
MIATRAFIIGAVVMLGLSVPASGHHSFAAYYFEDQSIEIEGDIAEVQFKAPHAWVHITTRDAAGTVKRYAAEWANPSRLERDGLTKDTLKVSDFVRISGSPSRDPNDGRIHLKHIVRPRDGWEWRPRRR